MSTARVVPVATLLFTLLPLVALGQAAEKQISILAMDLERPSKLLVRNHDPNAGTSLQVLEVPTGKVKKGWFVESKQDERRRVKTLTRKRFPIEATPDQMEPRGRYTIMGAPDQRKRNYRVMAMRDGRIGVLATIPLRKNEEAGTWATGMLKEVVWTPSGKTILCVVNQKLDLSDGVWNVDEVHFVKFRPWKVKWIEPEGGGGDQEAPK